MLKLRKSKNLIFTDLPRCVTLSLPRFCSNCSPPLPYSPQYVHTENPSALTYSLIRDMPVSAVPRLSNDGRILQSGQFRMPAYPC